MKRFFSLLQRAWRKARKRLKHAMKVAGTCLVTTGRVIGGWALGVIKEAKQTVSHARKNVGLAGLIVLGGLSTLLAIKATSLSITIASCVLMHNIASPILGIVISLGFYALLQKMVQHAAEALIPMVFVEFCRLVNFSVNSYKIRAAQEARRA